MKNQFCSFFFLFLLDRLSTFGFGGFRLREPLGRRGVQPASPEGFAFRHALLPQLAHTVDHQKM